MPQINHLITQNIAIQATQINL